MGFLPYALLLLVADGSADDFAEVVAPILAENCSDCHGGEEPEGQLDLVRFRGREDALAEPRVFRKIHAKVSAAEMPPAFMGALPKDDKARLLEWIETNVKLGPRPQPIRLRRLNREELRRTVLDLFELDIPVEEWFPPDAFGEGFDTTAGAQSISPGLLEASLRAAERIADLALPDPAKYEPSKAVLRSGELETPGQVQKRDGQALLPNRHRVIGRLRVDAFGTYRVRVLAGANHSEGVRSSLAISIAGEIKERTEVSATGDQPSYHEFRFELDVGEHVFGVHYYADASSWKSSEGEAEPQQELSVRAIEIQGPLEAPPRRAFHARLQGQHPSADDAVRALSFLVWRRPPADEEVVRLLELTHAEDSWEARVRTALVGLLASPHFLLRAEGLHGESYALASRLSFFLWSSTPDERLLQLAALDLLDEAFAAEVERMLLDPRASSLAERFVPQWLQLDRLTFHVPDPRRFPGVDRPLLVDMREESQLFFDAVLREGRGVDELLTADFTFLNEELARHYEIPGVRGASFRRVAIPKNLRRQRGGLLGQASVLTATSNPTRTSPVLRGKWLMEVVLGAPPPPPPPGVGDLADGRKAERSASLRERLEQHRTDPSCAVCHEAMDGLGFGLENYDAVGRWRTRDGHFELDTRGRLPDGRAFDDPATLREELSQLPDFAVALGQSLARFGLGRSLTNAEREELRSALAGLRKPTLAQVVTAVCTSSAFRSFELTPEASPGYDGGER